MNPLAKRGEFQWKVDNILDLGMKIKYSDIFEIGGLKWKLGIHRKMGDLVLTVQIVPNNMSNGLWLCKLRGFRKMLKQDGKSDHYIRSISPNFCLNKSKFHVCYSPFNDWNIMKTGGFIKDGAILIEIELDFVFYHFALRIDSITNMIIDVDGIEFLCNRDLLAVHSKYFQETFRKMKQIPNKILVQNIEATEFLHFLATFSPIPLEVSEENVIGLMNVADHLRVPSLHYKCERFLINSEECGISDIEKVEYASKYNYETLMKIQLSKFKTASEVKNFTESEGFENLSDSTKLRFFREMAKFV